MPYLLFTFYFILLCLLVTRMRFVKNAGLSRNQVLLLFSIKIAAAAFIGWMSQKFYPQGNDYWGLNESGWKEYKFLVADPIRFIKDIFHSNYDDNYGGFFGSVGTYWNDLKNTLIGKVLAICNFFSAGNYYINSLFFNVAGFLGHVALFRVFKDIYKDQYWTLIIGCFLLPSTLYFSSGIHKDLVVFSMLGLYSFSLYFSLAIKMKARYFLALCLSFFTLVLIRNFVAIALLPATLLFIIIQTKKWKPWFVGLGIYGSLILLIFAAEKWLPSYQPLKIITEKQSDFRNLPTAITQIGMYPLSPTVKSFVSQFPQAIDHGFLRPYIWEHPTFFLLPLSIELLLYEVLFFLFLVYHKKNGLSNNFLAFGCCLSVTILLFTGYVIPVLGAIVRYRSLYLPLLITPVLAGINWGAFKRKFNIK